MIGHLKRHHELPKAGYTMQYSDNIDKLSHTVCIDDEVADTQSNVCMKTGWEGPAVRRGPAVGFESLAVQGKERGSQRIESDLKETPELSSKIESTSAAKGVNNFSRDIGSTGEAQELGGYRGSKPTVAPNGRGRPV